MQSSSLLCYIFPIRSTHLPQQPILKHPQPMFLPHFQTDEVLHTYKTSEAMNNNVIKIILILTAELPHFVHNYLLFLAVTYDTFL